MVNFVAVRIVPPLNREFLYDRLWDFLTGVAKTRNFATRTVPSGFSGVSCRKRPVAKIQPVARCIIGNAGRTLEWFGRLSGCLKRGRQQWTRYVVEVREGKCQIIFHAIQWACIFEIRRSL
jgi:hypothetical protein